MQPNLMSIISPTPAYRLPAWVPIAAEGIDALTHPVGKRKPCRTFAGAKQCGLEWDEWMLVQALIRPDSTVLELGARYGTTSCTLAGALNNSGRLVSVEPDGSVHAALLANRASHWCNFHLLNGTVSLRPHAMLEQDADARDVDGKYGTRFRTAASVASDKVPAGRGAKWQPLVPNVPFRQLEAYLGGPRINTLLIDCEGCIGSFLDGQEELLDGIELLLLVEDWLMIEAINETYVGRWYDVFRRHGLELIWRIRDTTAPRETWSKILHHSAWARGGLRGRPTCQQYAAAHNYSWRILNCI